MGPSTKRRLAVDTMIDLALRERAAPVPLAAIASRQQVSLSCLGQLLARLRTAGLVESTRGPGGGYTLGLEAAAISVADIVVAVEAGAPGTDEDDGRPSLANDLSQRLDAVMLAHMAGIALADLVAGQSDAGALVEVRPRRGVVAARPQASPVSASGPNSAFEFGTTIAMAGARPGGR